MALRWMQPVLLGLFVSFLAFFGARGALGAPYAAMVIDARNGEVIYQHNANARLHPASLTKMMTLYIAFEAIQNGEIGLDTQVTISRNAAAEPPSKLGVRAGQKIALRYLIRAAAVKSANDAATAIGEAISGSEAAFARRMNATARTLGMSRTTFRNANGLTESGHLSTAHDMTILGRHLFYDYPQYYNIFSRQTANAGVRDVNHTNSRLLESYRGADGIKTGYTRAAGFNLVASAERGNERIIATVFGGTSVAARNAKVTELLDLGFRKAPTNVALRRPRKPAYPAAGTIERPRRVAEPVQQSASSAARVATASAAQASAASAAASRASAAAQAVVRAPAPTPAKPAATTPRRVATKSTPRPKARPGGLAVASASAAASTAAKPVAAAAPTASLAALAPRPRARVAGLTAKATETPASKPETPAAKVALATAPRPRARPGQGSASLASGVTAALQEAQDTTVAAAVASARSTVPAATSRPRARPAGLDVSRVNPPRLRNPEVVARASTR